MISFFWSRLYISIAACVAALGWHLLIQDEIDFLFPKMLFSLVFAHVVALFVTMLQWALGRH